MGEAWNSSSRYTFLQNCCHIYLSSSPIHPADVTPRVSSRASHCSLIIQIPAAAISDTPLCCLHIITTFTCILPSSFSLSFFLFLRRFGPFSGNGFPLLGFRDICVHEVRMSAPRTTPTSKARTSLWHRSRNCAPWVALPAECRRRGFRDCWLMPAPSTAQMCLRQVGNTTEGLLSV